MTDIFDDPTIDDGYIPLLEQLRQSPTYVLKQPVNPNGVMGGLAKPEQLEVVQVPVVPNDDCIYWIAGSSMVDTEGLYFRTTQEILRSVDVSLTTDQFKHLPAPGVKAVSSRLPSMASQMTRSHDCGRSGTGYTPSCWVRSRGPMTVQRKCCGRCTAESGWSWWTCDKQSRIAQVA